MRKKRYTTRHLVITALLLALGLLLPSMVHLFGSGNVFLPMHIPVFLGAFLLPLPWAALVALVLPTLSHFVMAMPPLYPVLPIMTLELLGYAVGTGVLSRQKKQNTVVSLLFGMVVGRGTMLMMALLLSAVGGLDALGYFVAAVTVGIPGMVIQILVLPPLVYAVKRALGYPPSGKRGTVYHQKKQAQTFRAKLLQNEVQLVVWQKKDNDITFGYGKGVAPLLDLYLLHPTRFVGATVFDRAVGLGAAVVLARAGVSEVETRVLSTSAKKYLEGAGIVVRTDILVPKILNRKQTGYCPLETRLMPLFLKEETADNLFAAVCEFRMMQK